MMLEIKQDQILSKALHSARGLIANELIASACLYPRWKATLVQEGPEAVANTHLAVFVDYLAKAFEEGNSDYLSLYAGEKLKQRYDPTIDEAKLQDIFATELSRSHQIICAQVKDTVGGSTYETLHSALEQIEKLLTPKATKTLTVLWIADCIYLDIQAFLIQKLASMQLSLDIKLVTTKNPVARRQEIQALAAKTKFDCVFYSPLTYELDQNFAQFLEPKAVLSNRFDKTQVIDATVREIDQTLECLIQHLECDIFVHNTANILRTEDKLKDRAGSIATSKARKESRDRVNAHIEKQVAVCNQTAFGTVYMIDEMALVDQVGEWQASQYLHKSPLQHPARLGALLANVYADLLFVEARLRPIKVVVSDLDNTLWNGTIGEGEVAHYHDRQKILRKLRENGVLLAINSKNDPKNVHWRGASLDDDDFVSAQINWDPKPQNMVRIQGELNLKFRNFLFVDDRIEEREMVRMSGPEILCLDAESEQTWHRLRLWADIIKNSGELDRTLMYKQRAEREKMVVTEIDAGALMAQLDLVVEVRPAQALELPRVTELVNRTTQFNCRDSRVTFRDMQNRSQADDWKIYVAVANDKFGSMGIVSVLVARIDDGIVDVDAFVLSCRVFGYGMETAILKKLADDHINTPIRGQIVPTPVNGPCQNVFRDHGFVELGGGIWERQPGLGLQLKPWLRMC